MRQTKEEMVIDIVSRVNLISEHYAELKLKDGHLFIHEDAANLKVEDIREAHKWILAIFDKQYLALINAIKLLKPEQWKRYELWGDDFNEHQEVVIRRNAAVELRKALVSKARPNFFKKGYVNGQLHPSEGQESSENVD